MLTKIKMLFNLILAIGLILGTSYIPVSAQAPAVGTSWIARITQVDTSQFPRVTVYVSVTDANGEPVEISPSRLVLLENGVPMTPEEIKGVGELDQPLTTMLVLDVSGSMNSEGKLDAAKEAARAYVKQTRSNDQTGVLAFNTKFKYIQPVTQDQNSLIKSINSLKADNDTALYDALVESIGLLSGFSGRKAIIALTDGMDNRSQQTPDEVIQKIDPAGISISTIGFGDPQYSYGVLAGLDEAALTYLAEQAGGVYGYANDAESLRNLYERYGRALQSEYAITYYSPATLRDGVNRSLSVSIKEGAVASVAEQSSTYNPGGIVPEVGEPASWLVFGALMIALIVLLILPMLISMFMPKGKKVGSGRIKLGQTRQGTTRSTKSSLVKPTPKIRFKD